MKNKRMFIVSVVLCSVMCRVCSTSFLLQNLKKGLLDGRCKLHKFGSKIIQHEHHHGDPCQVSEAAHEHPSSTAKEELNLRPVEVTSEVSPSSLNIDIRAGQEETTAEAKPTSVTESHKDEYQPVPEKGGKQLIKVGCNARVQTDDGCMEEI